MADSHGVPDLYTDFVNVLVSAWGVALGFRTTTVPFDALTVSGASVEIGTVEVPTELKAVVRMSHSHAKALVIQMKKTLKLYAENIGKIIIPEPVVRRLGIQITDW